MGSVLSDASRSSAASSRSGRSLANRCLVACCLAALTGLLGCKEEPPPAAEAKTDAPAEKKPAVDEKIANAMAAAEASARAEAPPTSGQGTPPPDGILGIEAAAREVAPGGPAQLVLGGDGAAPRVQLGPDRLVAGPGPSGKLVLSYRSGGSVMPTIEFELKPKVALAGGATQPAFVSAAGGDAGQVTLHFALAAARPSADQPGRLPDNARAEIAKLSGSYVELVAAPNGALVEQRQKLAGNNPDLEPLVTGSAEVLASVILPYPEVPVGVGAFWMIKSREAANGAPVIAYRMLKLTELSPTLAKLSVSTRRYLIEPSLPMAGLPPHQVRRFESEGEATLSVKPGKVYPESAEARDTFMALVTPNDNPSQAAPIRSELSASVSFTR